ncbi:MAG: OmpA family protein [Bacteroidaceae bacterium]|nr:OmpA family protein [Bacteroidaceae bacterium]
MKRTKLTILMAAVAFLGCQALFAQECTGECQELGYRPYPHGFIQLQGGVGTTLTDVECLKLLSPTASIGAGAWFGPSVGARLHVNAWESKGGFKTAGDPLKYKYNYVNTNADLMLNVLNLFSQKKYHKFNVILIGGIGLNYAWKNDEFHQLLNTYTPTVDISNAWGEGTSRKHLLSHNIRAGLLFDFNIAKHWGVGIEVDANSLDDRFNSKFTDSDDWMITAQLGITYKFGFKAPHEKKQEPVKPVQVVQPTPVVPTQAVRTVEPVKAPEPVRAPEPAKVVEEPYKDVLFYAIRDSEIDPESIITAAAAWCKKYPNKTVTVSGYADKGTGNAKLNMMYSQQRTNKVVDMLKKKGVPASQIKSAAYGDTVQPFSENDKNRCVIIEGK